MNFAEVLLSDGTVMSMSKIAPSILLVLVNARGFAQNG